MLRSAGTRLYQLDSTVRQPSGKRVIAYALEAEFDVTGAQSNLFEMEWPRRSGILRSFPEVDRAEWVDCATARTKLVVGQIGFLDRLLEQLRGQGHAVQETAREVAGETVRETVGEA